MRPSPPSTSAALPSEHLLPISVLASYLFFLLRRPISASNSHYLAARIQGLQSLATELRATGHRGIDAVGEQLAAMQPANFARVARDLQFRLALLHKAPAIPLDYIVSHRPPSVPVFEDVNRVLLVLGPAIGIGDEMILFPLPSWLQEARPGIEVTVMSGYAGLWDRVAGVHQRRYYSTHRELVDALRGARKNGFDAIVLADFEKPGLVSAVCRERDFPLYVELSLGGQYAAIVHARQKRIQAVGMPLEARLNYYEALEWLLDWLGLETRSTDRYGGIVRRISNDARSPFRVFVSPFTSKYEPSLVYWSDLLALVSESGIHDLEFAVDAGVSLSTERFATALIRSAAARGRAGRRFALATDRGCRTLTLGGVFEQLERSQLVLCADSYAAHAGPLFGCATVVIARAGLENWRTPFARSFYFDLEQPLSQVAAAIARLLDGMRGGEGVVVPLGSASRLHDATARLKELLSNGSFVSATALSADYQRFTEAYNGTVRELEKWPEEYAGLLSDVNYERAWRPLDSNGATSEETLDQLRVSVARWENTNLRKILALAAVGGAH